MGKKETYIKKSNKELQDQYINEVAETFYEAIKNDTKNNLKWCKSWSAGDLQADTPHNPITRTVYKGLNTLMLEFKRDKNKYNSSSWLTYSQIVALGGNVIKGNKGTAISYFSNTKIVKEKNEAGEMEEVKKMLSYPVFKKASVFNLDQTENIDKKKIQELLENGYDKLDTFNNIEKCEQILKNVDVEIRHTAGAGKAFYRPSEDYISLPYKKQFTSEEAYYSTAFHELGHSTGHESRLNRDLSGEFGTDSYAKEELRAELYSYLQAKELGIAYNLENHQSYIKSWSRIFDNKKHEIVEAIKDSLKIVKYVNKTYIKIVKYVNKTYIKKENLNKNIEKWENYVQNLEQINIKDSITPDKGIEFFKEYGGFSSNNEVTNNSYKNPIFLKELNNAINENKYKTIVKLIEYEDEDGTYNKVVDLKVINKLSKRFNIDNPYQIKNKENPHFKIPLKQVLETLGYSIVKSKGTNSNWIEMSNGMEILVINQEKNQYFDKAVYIEQWEMSLLLEELSKFTNLEKQENLRYAYKVAVDWTQNIKEMTEDQTIQSQKLNKQTMREVHAQLLDLKDGNKPYLTKLDLMWDIIKANKNALELEEFQKYNFEIVREIEAYIKNIEKGLEQINIKDSITPDKGIEFFKEYGGFSSNNEVTNNSYKNPIFLKELNNAINENKYKTIVKLINKEEPYNKVADLKVINKLSKRFNIDNPYQIKNKENPHFKIPLKQVLETLGYSILKSKGINSNWIEMSNGAETLVINQEKNLYFNRGSDYDKGGIYPLLQNRDINPKEYFNNTSFDLSKQEFKDLRNQNVNYEKKYDDMKIYNKSNEKYLESVRKIDKNILSNFSSIKIDEYKNIVFPTYTLEVKNGKKDIRITGINKKLPKPILKDKNGILHDKPIKTLEYGKGGISILKKDKIPTTEITKIITAEHSIDGLSYMEIKKISSNNTMIVSFNGTMKEKGIEVFKHIIKEFPNLKQVINAFDNDKVGFKNDLKVKELLKDYKKITVTKDLPKVKDWNMQLVRCKNLNNCNELTR